MGAGKKSVLLNFALVRGGHTRDSACSGVHSVGTQRSRAKLAHAIGVAVYSCITFPTVRVQRYGLRRSSIRGMHRCVPSIALSWSAGGRQYSCRQAKQQQSVARTVRAQGAAQRLETCVSRSCGSPRPAHLSSQGSRNRISWLLTWGRVGPIPPPASVVETECCGLKRLSHTTQTTRNSSISSRCYASDCQRSAFRRTCPRKPSGPRSSISKRK